MKSYVASCANQITFLFPFANTAENKIKAQKKWNIVHLRFAAYFYIFGHKSYSFNLETYSSGRFLAKVFLVCVCALLVFSVISFLWLWLCLLSPTLWYTMFMLFIKNELKGWNNVFNFKILSLESGKEIKRGHALCCASEAELVKIYRRYPHFCRSFPLFVSLVRPRATFFFLSFHTFGCYYLQGSCSFYAPITSKHT